MMLIQLGHRITLCGILLAVAMTGSALGQETVNYGVQPDTDPTFIAKALGYFGPIEKQYNVKIALRQFS